MPQIDLSACPVVDAHMHPFDVDDVVARDPAGLLDRVTMLGMCLTSSGLVDRVGADAVAAMTDSTPLATTFARHLAARLGCAPGRAAVSAARHAAIAADPGGYLRGLWADARIAGVVCDEGYPQPTIPLDRFAATTGLAVHRVFRIEVAIAAAREGAAGYDELEDALAAACEAAAAAGAVAFKSVIAYRTGLDIAPVSAADARAAFDRWRADGWRESREHAKPVRDRLLHRVMEVARATDRPVHIHCGGGDPEIVLGHARPQDLVPFLTRHLDQPVVLIHAGQPWLAEGAYVASILPNAYLELSITIPWASLAVDQLLELVLGVAPTSKVLYGSDEASEPEVLWLAAHVGRAALGRVLGRGVEHGWLVPDEAARIGADVLAGNVLRLHGIAG